MGYAVRNDGQGWRAVNGQKDVGPDERFSKEQPAPVLESAEEVRKAEILAALEGIDKKSVRPMREGDAVRVAALEAQAASLRAELKVL